MTVVWKPHSRREEAVVEARKAYIKGLIHTTITIGYRVLGLEGLGVMMKTAVMSRRTHLQYRVVKISLK